jgi:hypothetical protein
MFADENKKKRLTLPLGQHKSFADFGESDLSVPLFGHCEKNLSFYNY